MRKGNPETINLDIMDPAPHLNPHLTFYFSDDVMKGWGGGSRGISYFVLSYEESSRKREKGFLEIFYSYSYIYESIYRVALNGDED